MMEYSALSVLVIELKAKNTEKQKVLLIFTVYCFVWVLEVLL